MVVIAEDGENAQRRAQGTERTRCARDVIRRMRNVIARERDQIGLQRVGETDGLGDLIFAQKRAVMDVGKLREFETVKGLWQFGETNGETRQFKLAGFDSGGLHQLLQLLPQEGTFVAPVTQARQDIGFHPAFTQSKIRHGVFGGGKRQSHLCFGFMISLCTRIRRGCVSKLRWIIRSRRDVGNYELQVADDKPCELFVFKGKGALVLSNLPSEICHPRSSLRLSIIIPVLNEEACIADILGALAPVAAACEVIVCEVIVVDGGSRDETVKLSRAFAWARVLEFGQAQRAAQMNAGAAVARGAALLFLHADVRLPDAFADLLAAALRDERVVGGCFAFGFPPEVSRAFQVYAWGVNWRTRWAQTATGDQAIWVRRAVFNELGGFRLGDRRERVEHAVVERRRGPED